ncbi:MAG: DUF1326 domain-containing protein [Chloroflexota bacterium]|nr:DUF1326 domain-containing protein [Chloroflexota bacterium]
MDGARADAGDIKEVPEVAETWSMSGEYLANCNCRVSPCPCTTAGGDPTEGTCNGLTVFQVTQGTYGNVDLSGLHFGLLTRWTGNVLKGNWDVAILIDDKAKDPQAEAIETMLSGKAGGTFADLGPLIGKVLGVERVAMTFETKDHGESGRATAGGCIVTYKPLMGAHGHRTELHHGALAFREKIYPGKAEGGRINQFGIQGEMNYGEWSDFEFQGP